MTETIETIETTDIEVRQPLVDTVAMMRRKLNEAHDRALAWQLYALELEVQMRREGWTQEDLDSLEHHRP